MPSPNPPVTFVVGSYPPDLCGVGDYTAQLAGALTARGNDVVVERAPAGTPARRLLRSLDGDRVVHLQYPSVGAGRSLVPLLVAIVKRPILTVHEYSRARLPRRIVLRAMAYTARRVVFTTPVERAALTRHRPALRHRSTVIPIGSNVLPVPAPGDQPASPDVDVMFFGLLGPGKGLESFVELVAACARGTDARSFAIVGGWPPQNTGWVQAMQSATAHLPIHWSGALSPDGLGAEMRRARVAYLPFPDGASERRGSLLATLASDIPTITTDGAGLTAALRDAVWIAESPAQARELLGHVGHVGYDGPLGTAKRDAARRLVAERQWDAIAARHEALYRSVWEDPARA